MLVGGCASTASLNSASNPVAVDNTEINDPWESWNRRIYRFNEHLDQYVLKPVATTYRQLLPQGVRSSVSNFFSNLTEPTTIINDLLQGQFEQTLLDTGRFVFNTSFGLLGLFDFAAYLDMPAHREDFGQTLAIWGVPPGPYVVLPLLGSGSVRDAVALIPEYYRTDGLIYIADNSTYWTATSVLFVDIRSNKLGLEKVLDLQLDPYLFVKESYTQSRLNAIFNGEPPLSDDFLDEEPSN